MHIIPQHPLLAKNQPHSHNPSYFEGYQDYTHLPASFS